MSKSKITDQDHWLTCRRIQPRETKKTNESVCAFSKFIVKQEINLQACMHTWDLSQMAHIVHLQFCGPAMTAASVCTSPQDHRVPHLTFLGLRRMLPGIGTDMCPWCTLLPCWPWRRLHSRWLPDILYTNVLTGQGKQINLTVRLRNRYYQ